MGNTADCGCSTDCTTVVEVPGAQGEAGDNGTDGLNAYTVTTSDFTVPSKAANVTVPVESSDQFAIGQTLFVASSAGTFVVISKPASTSMELQYYDFPSNTATGLNIPSGTMIVPSGPVQVLLASMPNVFTISSGGTDSDGIASTVGIYVLPIPIALAEITGAGDVLTTYTPGHAFEIIGVDARVTEVVTTVGKAVDINLEINTTDLTGGVVQLTSAGCTPLGAAIAGSAVTGNNTGTAAQSISIEAANVTAFAEGSVVLLIKIRNMDDVNAYNSLATHINGIINALV